MKKKIEKIEAKPVADGEVVVLISADTLASHNEDGDDGPTIYIIRALVMRGDIPCMYGDCRTYTARGARAARRVAEKLSRQCGDCRIIISN